MTRSEYQELVDFIAPKFDKIDKRFDKVDERLTKVEVLREEDRGLIQGVAEGVKTNREIMTREFARVWSEFGTLRTEMAEGFEQSGLRSPAPPEQGPPVGSPHDEERIPETV